MKYIIVLILCCLLTFILWSPAQKQSISENSELFNWISDSEQSYKYEIMNRTKMGSDPDAIPTEVTVKGQLNLKIFPIGEKIEAGVYLSPLTITANDHEDSILKELYSTAFLVVFNRQGKFEEFFFPNSIATEDIPLLKGLIQPFEALMIEMEKYAFIQKDSLGTYTSLYKRLPENKIQKVKGKYVSENNQGLLGFQIEVKNSSAIFTPARKVSWLESFSGKDNLILKTEQQLPLFSVTNSYRLTLSDSNPKNVWGTNSFKKWQEIFQMQKKGTTSVSEKLEQARKATDSDKYSLGDLDNLLEDLKLSNTRKASLRVREYFYKFPEETGAVPTKLLNNSYSDEIDMKILNILGLTGTPVAQEALLTVMTDLQQKEKNRFRAAISLSSIEQPLSRQTIDRILNQVAKLQKEDPDLSINSTAILALGTVSQNLKNTFPEKARETGDALEKELQTPGLNEFQIKYLLKALGNTADPARIDVISASLSHQDQMIRRAAVESLQFMTDNRKEDLLISTLTEERDSRVTAAIADGLKGSNLSDSSLEIVLSRTGAETDSNSRRLLLEVLSEHLSFCSAHQEALNRILSQENSRVNKVLLDEMLITQKQ